MFIGPPFVMIYGTEKSLNVQITESRLPMTITGRRKGRVTERNRESAPAPSIAAASQYSGDGLKPRQEDEGEERQPDPDVDDEVRGECRPRRGQPGRGGGATAPCWPGSG